LFVCNPVYIHKRAVPSTIGYEEDKF